MEKRKKHDKDEGGLWWLKNLINPNKKNYRLNKITKV